MTEWARDLNETPMADIENNHVVRAATIVYAVNLPTEIAPGGPSYTDYLDDDGCLCNIAMPTHQQLFLSASLAGGQIAISAAQSTREVVKFRWLRVSSDAAIGAVWRLYVQASKAESKSAWLNLVTCAIFADSSTRIGELLPPCPNGLPLDNIGLPSTRLCWGAGGITHYPTAWTIIKVIELRLDVSAASDRED